MISRRPDGKPHNDPTNSPRKKALPGAKADRLRPLEQADAEWNGRQQGEQWEGALRRGFPEIRRCWLLIGHVAADWRDGSDRDWGTSRRVIETRLSAAVDASCVVSELADGRAIPTKTSPRKTGFVASQTLGAPFVLENAQVPVAQQLHNC